MDLFLTRGVRCSYLLISRESMFLSKLPLLLSSRHPKHTACRQFRFLEKHLGSLNQTSICNVKFERFSQTLLASTKVDTIRYSTPPPKTDAPPAPAAPAARVTPVAPVAPVTPVAPAAKSNATVNEDCYAPPITEPKASIFQRMKQMTKDYWYILIPVHVVTSIGWVTLFYVAATNGVDIIGILESLNLSEKYLDMIRGSNAGSWAFTYALYKIFTPLRYTVTVGGTTMSIRYLSRWGYLKSKKDQKLAQSLKCAEQHKAVYGKTGGSPIKSNQTQSNKT